MYEIQKLAERQREILRLVVLGYGDTAIASGLGINELTVKNVRNSPVAKRHLAALQAARDADTVDVSRCIIEAAPKAFDLIDKAVGSDNELALKPNERVNHAFKLLEIAGLSKKDRNVNIAIVDSDMLDSIKRKAIDTSFIEEAEVVG